MQFHYYHPSHIFPPSPRFLLVLVVTVSGHLPSHFVSTSTVVVRDGERGMHSTEDGYIILPL